ncbi:hypothetical protein I79_015335 [Cricetulus griseus]|uniref:Uncharacterized protein n=1 Tax=Cricetulus griseus TaxID=10029 RepID=G3HWK3_CRIGR|nr:hypothetical protein I79_015335 [Cricetulus griseus]
MEERHTRALVWVLQSQISALTVAIYTGFDGFRKYISNNKEPKWVGHSDTSL